MRGMRWLTVPEFASSRCREIYHRVPPEAGLTKQWSRPRAPGTIQLSMSLTRQFAATRALARHRVGVAASYYGASAPLSGHFGYAVVPWKKRLGYAKSALRLVLPEAKAIGLSNVEITTDPDNSASSKRMEASWSGTSSSRSSSAASRACAFASRSLDGA